MATENIKATETGDLESRLSVLEARVTILEQSSKKSTRKKMEYTDEQRAAIRARFLAGQEVAKKRREAESIAESTEPVAEVTVEPEPIKTEKPRKDVKTEKSKNKVAK